MPSDPVTRIAVDEISPYGGSPGDVATISSDGLRVEFDAPTGGAGGAIAVEEVDGSPADASTTKIKFPNGTLAISSHVATYTPAADGTKADKSLSVTATEGVQRTSGSDLSAAVQMKLDISGLTQDSTPDSANDYVATWDASASAHKKVKLSDLPAGGSTSPLTTKGDLWGFSTVDARLPKGSNGTILNADSGQTLGLGYSTRNLDAGGFKITDLADPSHGTQDAATANWVISLPLSGFSATPLGTISCSNGQNDDQAPTGTAIDAVITGVSADFSITGFQSTTLPDGHKFGLIYEGTDVFTLSHQHTGSVAANRIICPGNADLVLPGPCYAQLEYDLANTRWRVVGYAKAAATSAQLVPTSPSDATKFLNGAATPAFAQVKDSDLSTTNITTNNVTTAKHGFAPILPNDATKFLDGTGAYTVPPGTGTGTVTNIATAAPITGGPITGTGTIGVSIDTTNDGGAVAKQASSPGTAQTGSSNVSGSVVAGTSIGAGINAAPKTALDVAGLISVRGSTLSLSNGLNSNIALPSTGYVRITGPSAAFSIGGLVPPSSADGARIVLVNTTLQVMTIVETSGSSSPANRINTLFGANLVLPDTQSMVELTYDTIGGAWNVTGTYPVAAAFLPSLAHETAPTTSDYLLLYDVSSSLQKRIAISDLPVAFGGSLVVAPGDAQDDFDGDGVTVAFTASSGVASSIGLWINGNVQPTTAYSISVNTVTFVAAPITGDKITWLYFTSSPSSQTPIQEDFTGDGVTTDFVLAHTPVTGSTQVFAELLLAKTAWSIVAPATVRFVTAPIDQTRIGIIYRY